jgi:hypothetical protein
MAKPYSTMTEAERWAWHSEVYAFRRVILGASATERTSPPDPDGRWFDENLVQAAIYRKYPNAGS